LLKKKKILLRFLCRNMTFVSNIFFTVGFLLPIRDSRWMLLTRYNRFGSRRPHAHFSCCTMRASRDAIPSIYIAPGGIGQRCTMARCVLREIRTCNHLLVFNFVQMGPSNFTNFDRWLETSLGGEASRDRFRLTICFDPESGSNGFYRRTRGF